MLFSVEREDRRELSLLAPQKDGKKQARLMKAMDDINARYGHRTVTFASAGLPSDERPWKMNRSNLSRRGQRAGRSFGYSQGVNPEFSGRHTIQRIRRPADRGEYDG